MDITAYKLIHVHHQTTNAPINYNDFALTRGATTFSKLGVQFLSLGNYYLSTEKIHRSTQFGAFGYIITLYSSKSCVKSWGSV